MTAWERVFHAILFEVFAVIFTVILASIFTHHGTTLLSSTIIIMSLIAMIWNFIFNWAFDRVFKGERIHRGFWLRLFHTLTFEGGLLCFTIPIVMWMLNMSFWEAFLMDISITLFILVYTMAFNWIYDITRYKIMHRQNK